jgi:hypothetical protein
LISAYAVGLVLNMWALHGIQAATQTVPWPGGSWVQRLKFFPVWVSWKYVVLGTGVRAPEPAAMLGLLEIHDLLQGIYGAASMPLLLYPTTQLTVFRAAFCERIKDRVVPMLVEPEVERRRFVFSIGVALAMMVLAFWTLSRFAVAMVARIPAAALGDSASWRAAAPVLLLPAFAIFMVWCAIRIAGAGKWLIGALLVAAAGLAVAAEFAPAFAGLSMPYTGYDAAPLGLLLLAAGSITACLYLERQLGLARVLLPLFIASSACIAVSAVVHMPLLWVAGVTRWDAANQRQPLLLLAGGLVACYFSSKLREVAVRCLEREVAHTLAIVRIFSHFF